MLTLIVWRWETLREHASFEMVDFNIESRARHGTQAVQRRPDQGRAIPGRRKHGESVGRGRELANLLFTSAAPAMPCFLGPAYKLTGSEAIQSASITRSTHLVSIVPLANSSVASTCLRKPAVVWMPSIRNSSRARIMVAMACLRVG